MFWLTYVLSAQKKCLIESVLLLNLDLSFFENIVDPDQLASDKII